MTREENIQRFEEITSGITREGITELMTYIKKSDFYTAPASTRFHLACEGGLLQHSLNVYDCLMAKKENPIWKDILASIPNESLAIMSLFHDLCKTYFYEITTKNQKTYDADKVAAAQGWQVKHDAGGDFIWETVPSYTINDKMPLGHGEKSCFLLQNYIKLTTDELYAIRWHMGFSEPSEQWNAMGAAMEKHPIVLALHEADLEASKLFEKDV